MRTEPVLRLRSVAPERADIARAGTAELGELGALVGGLTGHMPYGGVKQSGSGREGIRYAIEEMTELRLLALNDRG